MLGYRKNAFRKAHSMLDALRSDASNFSTLTKLQLLLLDEIAMAEQKIRRLKADLKAIQGTGRQTAAKHSSYLQNRIAKVRQVAYVWRCFGDAIAFLYLDRFALKQVYFNVENLNPKNRPGFIIDKSGLKVEIATLAMAIDNGVPALLTDLTNTIRHGDICILLGPDPHLIEVKTSKKLDRRGRKQRRALEVLHDFFESDEATGLRGLPRIHRAEYSTPERDHIVELTSAIDEALKSGHAVRKPEAGLTYVVTTANGPHVTEILDKVLPREPWVFQLNELKIQETWSPYYPFTLSLIKHDHLWGFVRGDIYLLVLVDLQLVQRVAEDQGVECSVEPEGGQPVLKIALPGLDAPATISAGALARIGTEFLSLEWVVKAAVETIQAGMAKAVDGATQEEQETAKP